jgi:drug/metabolite transporter superfamily protein YnfA
LSVANFYSRLNWYSDVVVKWGLIVVGSLVTILASMRQMSRFASAQWMGMLLIVFGALSTVMSTASSQFSFGKVKGVYQAKELAFQTLLDNLRYADPSRVEFMRRLQRARSWNSDTKLEGAHLVEATEETVSERTPTH